MEAFNRETYNAKEGKITARIVRLEKEYGATIKFSGVQSPKFYQNLLMIDMGMPTAMGEMLLAKYRHKLNTVRRCVEKLNETNPLHFNQSHGQMDRRLRCHRRPNHSERFGRHRVLSHL